MNRLLISGCEAVVTMDDAGTELAGGSILLEDGVIRWVGAGVPPAAAMAGADVLDGRGCVAIPGLVNTHPEADPIAGMVLAWPQRVRHLLVEGRFVVRDGALATVDEAALAAEAHRIARRIDGRSVGGR